MTLHLPADVAALYPFESHWLQRGNARMHYLDEGQGDPLLMVHGNPSWSFYYRELVKALRDDYRCIVPDHIGMGLSDKPDDQAYQYTLKSRVDDLQALVESLNLERPLTLIVHDWGGMIGMALAQRMPERIARLVILNTSAFPMPASKRLPFTLKLGRNTKLGALMIRGGNAFAAGATRMAVTRKMAPAVKRGFVLPYDNWANRIATLRFVQDIPLAPGDPAWDIVNTVAEAMPQFAQRPVLIAWGGKDFVFDHHFLAEFRRRWPAAEVHEYPEAGHYVLEDAGEQIIPLIRGFLQRHPLPA